MRVILHHLMEGLRRYRTAPLSALEHALIRNILKNSCWYALWLSLMFGLAIHALWGHVQTIWLMLFLTMFVVEVLIKISASRHFTGLPPEQQKQAKWRLVFDAGSIYSGLVYGTASLVLFLPLPEENRLLLVGVFCAMIANLSAATALFTPISRTMLPSLAAPVAIALMLSGRPMLILLALLIVASIACTVFLGRLSQQRYRDLARLNQENKALVESLSEQQRIAAEHQARAEQAVIDKSRFLAMASHDLRQPLHALGLFHHALRLKSEDASNKQLFQSIDQSTDVLNSMFDSLLDVSRLDANVVKPEIEVIELGLVCSILEQEFAPVAQEKDLYFCCITTQIRLHTDGTLLARILRNLISNAIKFTEEGGVTIRTEKRGLRLHIQVSDTGRGIPEEERQNVFSEFYQLEGEERFCTLGVGLGLSIVRRLCELLDIKVQLDMSDSGGTLVTLSMDCLTQSDSNSVLSASPALLPACVASADRSGRLESEEFESTTSMQGRCILFVDDDPEICRAMGNTLAAWGCQAICELGVQSALHTLESLTCTPDLLICDFQLADGKSGLDVIHLIRDRLAVDMPAILVSGVCGVEETALMEDSGFQCLTKPVSAEKLRRVIESMTRERACHR
ncbi:ATP-binding response regulator [Granulosicoccus sp. 3-233]|uniref:ATP-binding response regulator n=1 Tax=Granulosicoccus sp. 3-233 TaxID=3417969 RepID=UPI003D33E2EE